MFKKMLVVILLIALTLSLTACNALDMNVEELISPPKYDKDTYPIQKALERSAGKNITLKYPLSGEFRSAFIFNDVDGDGIEEALVFYSTNIDGTIYMHLNVIALNDGEWISQSDIKLVGSDIDKIMFSDLNNDNIPEIIVGWLVYGTVDKQVGIYTYDGKSLKQRAIEKYSEFLTGSLKTEDSKELIVINLNTSEKTSVVKILSLNDEGVSVTDSVMLDGGVTGYFTPVLSTLSNGTPALYIDATKGAGVLTEIVWYEKDKLKSTYDSNLAETKLTYRVSAVYMTDFDGNNIPEIPIMTALKSTEQKADIDKVYVTSWSSFDGGKLNTIANTFMNYTDKYYITIPNHWLNKIHLARKTDSRLRIFYGYDAKNDLQQDECFRIIAATKTEFEDGKYKDTGYEKLAEQENTVYLARIIEGNPLGVTFSVLTDNFHILNNK